MTIAVDYEHVAQLRSFSLVDLPADFTEGSFRLEYCLIKLMILRNMIDFFDREVPCS
ncbi:hypothetical protein X759_28585 [Mesorhizobium sp. LSHC420B00]|nr:hypothetical protein X759_28585 [Mesorhizobium sp. LSHC420B00]